MFGVLTGLVRISLLLGAGLFCMAVAVGRQAREPGRRMAVENRLAGLGILDHSRSGPGFRMIDLDLGTFRTLPLPSSDQLDLTSVAPWSDERGRRSIVGRWTRRSGQNSESLAHEFGLLRYDLASGEVLERVALDVLPTSPPCWYPDATARILFVGADGQIHRYAFEDASAHPLEPAAQRRAPLEWRCGTPTGLEPLVTDLCWPAVPGFERIVIATLVPRRGGLGKVEFENARLWSLRLDSECAAIVSAAPLDLDGLPSSDGQHRRRPAVGRREDGSVLLAYLEESPDTSLRLGVVPIALSPEGHAVVSDAPTCGFGEDCAPVTPAFGEGARTLTYVRGEFAGNLRVGRVSIQPAHHYVSLTAALAVAFH